MGARRRVGRAALWLLPLLLSPAIAAQDDAAQRGRAAYVRECAACHGTSGAGYGPVAWLLNELPPDLTLYRDRTTPFPRDHILNIVTGRVRLIPSHGSQMPYWRTMPDMDALLTYLESIQLRPYGAYETSHAELAAVGGRLFKVHCAACHGADGRGAPAASYVVGLTRPDLTTFGERHGGFDMRQAIESIGRCRDEDRDQEMPSWRYRFKRAGWGAVVTNANLEALARYLESIQQR
jgi:mono/diheme cytochrome c family protein